MPMESFHPPRRLLLGPGPSQVNPKVLEAVGRPTIGHLDPAFVGMMDEVRELLAYAFQAQDALTLPISAPGSAGMEACLVNLLEPGDRIVVCRNGVFGGRMAEIARRAGAEPIVVEGTWGRAVDPDQLSDTLRDHPDARYVAFVHAETSTGALSDAARLTRIAHEHDCLVIVDAVTSLGGVPLYVDAWGLDAVYSGSQKCLSCVPGLSPVALSQRALDVIKNRRTKVQSWFLDLNLVLGYWGQGQRGNRRAYHHTAPVNALYGLHEALLDLKAEGLEHAWARHRLNHDALRAGLDALGLGLLVPTDERLPQLNAVSIPEGVDDAGTRGRLLSEYGLEIGGGLGPLAGQIWRIGLMGYASQRENVLYCLDALEVVLEGGPAGSERGGARAAAEAAYRDAGIPVTEAAGV